MLPPKSPKEKRQARLNRLTSALLQDLKLHGKIVYQDHKGIAVLFPEDFAPNDFLPPGPLTSAVAFAPSALLRTLRRIQNDCVQARLRLEKISALLPSLLEEKSALDSLLTLRTKPDPVGLP
jgi:hypothetical protein